MGDDATEWRKKCEKAEDTLLNLKNLSVNAVRDYDDLQRRYDQNQKQYDELRRRLQETQEELRRVESVVPAAVAEYERVQREAEIQRVCRQEAEKYASEVHKKNSKLKRQSDMLFSKLQMSSVDFSVDMLKEVSEAGEDPRESSLDADSVIDERESLNKIIDDLKDQVLELETKLKLTEEDRVRAIENEQAALSKYKEQQTTLEQTQNSLREYESAVKKFHRASTLAVNEHEQLQHQLYQEQQLKQAAEQYAHKMLTQSKAAQRQSQALMMNGALDDKLMKALLDVEEITKALEDERREHKIKLEELEQTLDSRNSDDLEGRLDEQQQQLEDQRRAYADLEKWKDKLEKENQDLVDKLDVAEQKLRPPPPPPPPPPPAIIKPFAFFTKKKTPSAAAKGAKPVDEDMTKAMADMMNRIKTGKFTLRAPQQRRFEPAKRSDARALFGTLPRDSGDRPSLPGDMKIGENADFPGQPTAIENLESMMKTLKTSKEIDLSHLNGGDRVSSSSGNTDAPPGDCSELEKTFRRVRGAHNLPPIDEASSIGSMQSSSDAGSPPKSTDPMAQVPLDRMESTKV